MIRNLFRWLFVGPEETQQETRAKRHFNLTEEQCPMCNRSFKMHGMKQHWISAHFDCYYNQKVKYDTWYARRMAETREMT
jgi:hypothetical protein